MVKPNGSFRNAGKSGKAKGKAGKAGGKAAVYIFRALNEIPLERHSIFSQRAELPGRPPAGEGEVPRRRQGRDARGEGPGAGPGAPARRAAGAPPGIHMA